MGRRGRIRRREGRLSEGSEGRTRDGVEKGRRGEGSARRKGRRGEGAARRRGGAEKGAARRRGGAEKGRKNERRAKLTRWGEQREYI